MTALSSSSCCICWEVRGITAGFVCGGGSPSFSRPPGVPACISSLSLSLSLSLSRARETDTFLSSSSSSSSSSEKRQTGEISRERERSSGAWGALSGVEWIVAYLLLLWRERRESGSGCTARSAPLGNNSQQTMR